MVETPGRAAAHRHKPPLVLSIQCTQRRLCFVEESIKVAARYVMQHTETRWLTMKYVAGRILQQWKNLKEYFLKFFQKKAISSQEW